MVAAESAYFMLAFVNIGLVPDGGSSLFVPSRVGFARAAELALLGERLDARTALDWGLVNRVWPDDTFVSETAALLDRLASGATKSYAGTKQLLNRWLYEQMDDSSSSRRKPRGKSRVLAISQKGSRLSPRSGHPPLRASENERFGQLCASYIDAGLEPARPMLIDISKLPIAWSSLARKKKKNGAGPRSVRCGYAGRTAPP